MNHGGTFPATGHPGFTAVGIPGSLLRFAALHSYDNVREPRLPPSSVTVTPTARCGGGLTASGPAPASRHPVDRRLPSTHALRVTICDNDKKYGPVFERVAQASGMEVIHTPYAAARSNAICERFVGSLRRECLDHVLVIGVLQLIRILKEYVSYINQARPHTCTPRRTPA